MSNIFSNVGELVSFVQSSVTQYLRLFFTYSTPPGGGPAEISGLSFVGLFCVVLPLVGLGIGIIRRLVKIRA